MCENMSSCTDSVHTSSEVTCSDADFSAVCLDNEGGTRAKRAIENIKEISRIEGESKFERGPGKRRRPQWSSLSESDPAYRKEKKTRSAYVSRYTAQIYETRLEECVAASEKQSKAMKASLSFLHEENEKLRAEMRNVQTLVEQSARKQRRCPVPQNYVKTYIPQEECSHVASPASVSDITVSDSGDAYATPTRSDLENEEPAADGIFDFLDREDILAQKSDCQPQERTDCIFDLLVDAISKTNSVPEVAPVF